MNKISFRKRKMGVQVSWRDNSICRKFQEKYPFCVFSYFHAITSKNKINMQELPRTKSVSVGDKMAMQNVSWTKTARNSFYEFNTQQGLWTKFVSRGRKTNICFTSGKIKMQQVPRKNTGSVHKISFTGKKPICKLWEQKSGQSMFYGEKISMQSAPWTDQFYEEK